MIRHALKLLALCAVATSCFDLHRSNPLDPEANVSIVLHASRDTMTAIGQVVTFSAETPGFADAPIKWSYGVPDVGATAPRSVVGAGPTLDVPWIPQSEVDAALIQGKLVVTAWVGTRFAVYRVPLSQRFGGIRFDACELSSRPGQAAPSICVAFIGSTSGTTIQYQRADSLGAVLQNLSLPVPTFAQIAAEIISRDPSIISLVPQTEYDAPRVVVAAGERGATWLVYLADAAKDSVRVYADLRPATIQLSCPGSLPVGGQSQLTATVRGEADAALIAPYPLRWSSSGGRASVTQTGLVTGVLAGTATISVVEPITGITQTCTIQVTQ